MPALNYVTPLWTGESAAEAAARLAVRQLEGCIGADSAASMWSWASVPADTHTVLSCTAGQPPVHRSLCHHDYRTCIPQPTDSCLVVWHTAAVVAAMPTPWNAGVHAYMNAHPRQGRWAARWCLGLRHSRRCCCCCYGLAVGLFFIL